MTPRQRLLARMAGNIAAGLASRTVDGQPEFPLAADPRLYTEQVAELGGAAVDIARAILIELGVEADDDE